MTAHGPARGSSPRVAIVIVNWNGKEVTLECLRSLRAVPYANRTIIVVDNGSTDGSREAITGEFPGATVLAMASNLRFAGGNNAGMRHALEVGAEFVLLLNNDTVVAPDFLNCMVERMQSDPAIGIVAPAIYYHDAPDRFWFAGGRISLWLGTAWHTGIREVDRGQYNAARAVDYASGCCILIRRSVVDRIGMLDESFYMYGEDADWSMKTRRAGYSIVFEPRAKVWHKLSVSAGGHLSFYKMKNKFLSNFRFFARYASWYHWLVFPWLSILAHAVTAVRYVAGRE